MFNNEPASVEKKKIRAAQRATGDQAVRLLLKSPRGLCIFKMAWVSGRFGCSCAGWFLQPSIKAACNKRQGYIGGHHGRVAFGAIVNRPRDNRT